jgi:D-alanine-D-alanine ligase
MKIAIITGGLTGEREVSISSAKNIAKAINFAEIKNFIYPEEWDQFVTESKNFNLAIPIIHGKGGEDGEVQEKLEKISIPYLFSGINAHSTAIDKKRTKKIAEKLGINTAEEYTDENLRFPLFAKPRFGGSSIASGLCHTLEDLRNLQSQTTEEMIYEQPIIGREFTVGVIEHDGKNIALPIIEIVTPKDTFFDYKSKYDSENLAKEICPADISPELASKLQESALAVHQHLNVKNLSRCDFLVTEDGTPYFLEINTIPGMTHTSLIPKMLNVAKYDLTELLKEWCLKVI